MRAGLLGAAMRMFGLRRLSYLAPIVPGGMILHNGYLLRRHIGHADGGHGPVKEPGDEHQKGGQTRHEIESTIANAEINPPGVHKAGFTAR